MPLKKNNSGFCIPSSPMKNVQPLIYEYQKRLVKLRKREVHKTKEFMVPHSCEQYVSDIERLLKKGESIKPYLSKRIEDFTYHDIYLNCYGFHHLHLGGEIDKDGYIKRSQYLLIVKLCDNDVYFISVCSHEQMTSSKWNGIEQIRICYDNWPNLFHVLKGTFKNVMSDTDIALLLRNRILTPIKMNDNNWIAPQMGVTAGGNCIESILKSQER